MCNGYEPNLSAFCSATYPPYYFSLSDSTFSKFYRRHHELISKFNVGLKTLLHEGLSEPEFYGDLIYKFKGIDFTNIIFISKETDQRNKHFDTTFIKIG